MTFQLKPADAARLKKHCVALAEKQTWYEKQQFEELLVYRYVDELYALLETMRGMQFIYEFDWMAFGKKAEQLITDEALLAKADLETLRKLFTAHSRNESLYDGHMANMIDSGHFQKAVMRLSALV
jgi:hypothetical protein